MNIFIYCQGLWLSDNIRLENILKNLLQIRLEEITLKY